MRLLRLPRLAWMAVGATAAYLFDPNHGERRRARLTEQVKSRRSSPPPVASRGPSGAVLLGNGPGEGSGADTARPPSAGS